MDGLISLLIIFGISALFSSNKKKKAQQKQAQKMRSFAEAAQSIQEGKKAFDSGSWKELLKAQLEENPLPAGKTHALKSAAPKVKAPAPGVQAASPRAKRAEPVIKPEGSAPPSPQEAPAPLLFLENDAPEGSISTQGESAAEHAQHHQRILAQEARLRQEHQALQEVRSMNLQKLRSAVVMSEILDKPVSLRRRRTN